MPERTPFSRICYRASSEGRYSGRRTVATAMKEIVLVRLVVDPQIGALDSTAPFVVIPRRRVLQHLPGRGGMYGNEPRVIEQFQPGEREAQIRSRVVEAGNRVEIRQASGRRLIEVRWR
jgi:hypothetical protein